MFAYYSCLFTLVFLIFDAVSLPIFHDRANLDRYKINDRGGFMHWFTKISKSKLWNSLHLQNEINPNYIQDLLINGPVPANQRVFLINGWRWHTQSVHRDLRRFATLAQRLQSGNSTRDKLIPAYNFVIKFNWGSLLSVEKDVFLPWLDQHLPISVRGNIEEHHNYALQLSEKLGQQCRNYREGLIEVDSILKTLSELQRVCSALQKEQDEKYAPLIAAYVPAKEQKAFNNRVIRGLGLLNSQIHLVSMYEAVLENEDELRSFKAQIPKLAQAALPLWRSRVYQPRSACLE